MILLITVPVKNLFLCLACLPYSQNISREKTSVDFAGRTQAKKFTSKIFGIAICQVRAILEFIFLA